MFAYNDSFVMTDKKLEKINHKIDVLNFKVNALTQVVALFEPYNGKVLNARVFNGVKEAFNMEGSHLFISTSEYTNGIEISLSGNNITYSEGQFTFYSNNVKKGERLDYALLKSELEMQIEKYKTCIYICKKSLKTINTTLEKAKKAFETLKEISNSLPYEIKEEFNVLKEIY